MKLFTLFLFIGYVYSQRIAPRITECRIDLVLVVDASGSIYQDGTGTEANWVAIRRFLEEIVSSFIIARDQAKVAAITFASEAQVEWNLNQYDSIGPLINRIRNLQHPNGGTTNAEAALELVLNQVFVPGQDRGAAPNVVFFVTDGRPNPYYEDSFNNILQMVQSSVSDVVGVAVGSAVDEMIMDRIDRDFVSVNDFAGLEDIVENLVDRFCRPITTTTTMRPDPCPEPIHTIFFSAWSTSDNVLFDDGHEIEFNAIETNMGSGYDGMSRFYCPCPGYYEFQLSISGIDFGMGAMLMRDNMPMNPMAYLQYGQGNSMSTSAIFSCFPGEYVWVQVMMTHAKNPMMPCLIDGHSLMGFTGKLITTMNHVGNRVEYAAAYGGYRTGHTTTY